MNLILSSSTHGLLGKWAAVAKNIWHVSRCVRDKLKMLSAKTGQQTRGDGGGGHWLVRMEWRSAGWSVCLPLLIFPCTIKSRSSLLAPAHPVGPGKGRKTVVVVRQASKVQTI